MKVMLFNASPRKNWCTYKLLKEAERGAFDAGADTELINLYDYKFKGCISCFACKRKSIDQRTTCAVKDEITDILERAAKADVLIFGSPVYLHGATAQYRAFQERLLFPITSYSVDENGARTRILSGTTPTGLIYTMNNTETNYVPKHYDILLGVNGDLLRIAYGHNEILCAFDTYQFDDYDKYRANLFNVEKKTAQKDNQFPVDLKKAYDLGKRLTEMTYENK